MKFDLRLIDVPFEYKQYPIIGRGSTSIIFRYTHDLVFILTIDAIKYKWLDLLANIYGFNINYKIISNITVKQKQLPLYKITCPYFEKCSKSVLFEIEMNILRPIRKTLVKSNRTGLYTFFYIPISASSYKKYDNIFFQLERLQYFVQRLKPSDYNLDLFPRNVKYYKNTELLIDPLYFYKCNRHI